MFDELIGRMILEPIMEVLLKPFDAIFDKIENSSRRVRLIVAVLLGLLLMAPLVLGVVYLAVYFT